MTYVLLRHDASVDAATRWPPVLDVPAAGKLLGLNRSAAYALVKAGQWPTPVITLGRRLRIPTAPLLALLGVEVGDAPISEGRIAASAVSPSDGDPED